MGRASAVSMSNRRGSFNFESRRCLACFASGQMACRCMIRGEMGLDRGSQHSEISMAPMSQIWEAVRRASAQYALPAEYKPSYGTAGYRTSAGLLQSTVFR